MTKTPNYLSIAAKLFYKLGSPLYSVLFVLASAPKAYWRGGDRLSDALFNTLIALRWNHNTRTFARNLGYMPNYAAPRSFSEKMQWRKLFDRNSLFPLLSDKLAVRDYVRARAPDLVLPKIYWSGGNPEAIPFDDLRPPFVIKPNNRSGRIILVREKSDLDRKAILRAARKWKRTRSHGWRFSEWAYSRVPNRILIEEFLSTSDALVPPPDFKVFVFHGVVEFIYFSQGRHSDRGRLRGLYSRDWQHMAVDRWSKRSRVTLQGDVPRPGRLADLIAAAEAIAADLDHLRVDLYLVGDKIYFGETTVYAYSGRATWFPKNANTDPAPPRFVDDDFGARWTLPSVSRREQLKRGMLGSMNSVE
ncbi:MAG: ATP-grasp fold amidoligase family protein [Filomicrobium sp.]